MHWIFYGEACVPVQNLFDRRGREVAELKEAVAFVAGPLPDGGWLCGRVDEWPELRKH